MERGERFLDLDILLPAAAKLFALDDVKSREEAEILFLYLGRFFAERDGVVALGVDLLKQNRTDAVLKRAIFYTIANVGSINYDQWNETFLYLAKNLTTQLSASQKVEYQYHAANIYDTMFYHFNREEDRLNALKEFEYVAQNATTPYWKKQALFNITLLKRHKGK